MSIPKVPLRPKIGAILRPALRRFAGCLLFVALLWVLVLVVFLVIFLYQNLSEMERLARTGNATSQERLGRYYDGGTNDVVLLGGRFAPSKQKAIYWLEAAEKGGDVYATYELPRAYEKNFPGTRNADVINWYKEAARKGFPQAAVRLSEIYANGELGQPTDPKKAAYWRAASKVAATSNRQDPSAT